MWKFGLQITQSRSHFETSNMTYGVHNPKLISLLKFELWIMQSESHFRTSNLTYRLHNPEYILLLKCTGIHSPMFIFVKEHKHTNTF